MKPKITVLIPTFARNALLRQGLSSLLRKREDEIEVIILDDHHEQDAECESIANEFGCRYIHSGQTKPDGGGWRIPGFAFNIGARRARGEHLILSCAEAYHPGNTLTDVLVAIGDNKVLIPRSVRDDRGQFIEQLRLGNFPGQAFIQQMPTLDAALPFFMSVPRDVFVEIGGYDEDFLGVCWDDNDITDRLIEYGCRREVIDADIVHLFHLRHNYRARAIKNRWRYNKSLYEQRKGIVVRNVGRQWGQIDLPNEPIPEPEPEPKNPSAPLSSSWGYSRD